MTVEIALAICVGAAFVCYLVYRWQEAMVDAAPEPYPVPQPKYPSDSEALTAEQITQVQAAWPFPTEKP